MKTDVLSTASIVQHAAEIAANLHVEVFDKLPSTNRYLVESVKLADKQRSWLVTADSQTAGVGRRGKSWVSEPGNISMSLLTHFDVPPSELMGLSLVTGVSVVSVIRERVDISCQLKWPNDILVDGAKLAGILIEIPQSTSKSCSVVTGIGINFHALSEGSSVEQQTAALMNSGASLDRNELIGKIAARLHRNYQLYCKSGLSVFAEEWDSMDYLKGKSVTVFLHDKEVEGIATGIDDTGELLVDIGGEVRSFNSGEVSVRRR